MDTLSSVAFYVMLYLLGIDIFMVWKINTFKRKAKKRKADFPVSQ